MIKYTVILLALLLGFISTQASENEKVNAIVMLNMENGLANIQKGFLYNNVKIIQEGVDIVSKENKIYHDRDVIRSILPDNKKQMENLALLTSKRIENATEEMKNYIALKQMKKAHNAYMDIVNACTDCHTLIRGW